MATAVSCVVIFSYVDCDPLNQALRRRSAMTRVAPASTSTATPATYSITVPMPPVDGSEEP